MLEEVKRYLAITWDEPITNDNLEQIIKEGEAHLNEKVGVSLDFDKDLKARALLKDYCRYVRNYTLEYFDQNFKSNILELQLKYAIYDNEEST